MKRARVLLLILSLATRLPAVGAAQIGTMAVGSVEVTPNNGGPLVVAPNISQQMALFQVENKFDTQQTFELSCSRTGRVSSCLVDAEAVTLGAGASTSVPVYFGTGAVGSGTLTLRADGLDWDTGLYNVSVVTPVAPAVVLAKRSDENWDQSYCLVAGAGEAAWRCGDLVVSHALPGYATLGRERSLGLVYTSTQATPRPVVTAHITAPTVPGGLTGIWVGLKVQGTRVDSARYLPWTSGTRQVALDFNADGYATGAYPFQLEVRAEYETSSYGDSVSGALPVVNRSGSLLGRGWSVGGVETLVFAQPVGTATGDILWVGGEGSARLYHKLDATHWVAPAGAYRDTLAYDGGSQTYTRTLRHGIQVVFDAQGRHIRTVNRAGQQTRFFGTVARLDSVRVPPDSVAKTTYRLVYDGAGKLDKIIDPSGRELNATVTGGLLTSLVDPDSKTTSFQYDGSGRMTRRVNRRGHGTRFAYANGLRLTEVRVPINASADSAVTVYAPWDEQGLAVAFAGQVGVDTAQIVTKVFGPRVGISDDATFKVDKWGAPVRITDPLGATTTLVRGNAAVPAQVTQVTYPNGRRAVLSYDNRGNLTEERVVTAGLPDPLPDLVTHYRYNSSNTKDAPDSIIAPDGIVTRFSYTSLGLLDQATAPNGHVTDFDYVTSGALVGTLRKVSELNVPVWDSVQRKEVIKTLVQRFGFNAWGNLVADTSPKGRIRTMTRDTLQRVIHTYDPAGHHVSYTYDLINRLMQVREHLEEVPGSGYSSPLLTQYLYGTDLLDTIYDPRNVRRTWRYDRAGRVLAEGDEAGAEYQYTYDAAGLVVEVATPMGYPPITHQYDAGGRRTKTNWPSRIGTPPDSLRVVYDQMGQVIRAEAEGRAIARSYYPTGALKRDSSNLVVDYGYDAAGRRSWYRTGLSAAVNRDSVVYRYDAVIGDLATIAVRWWSNSALSDSVRFRWDALGRRDTLLYSNGAKVLSMYDEDGMLRVLCGIHSNPPTAPDPSVFNFAVVHTWADGEGLIRRTDTGQPGITGCGSTHFQSVGPNQDNVYDARHQLTRQIHGSHDWTYSYDASGNRIGHVYSGETWQYTYPTASNRLATRVQAGAGVTWSYQYWFDGARATESPCGAGNPCPGWRGYKYDALGRTRATDEHACDYWDPETNSCTGWGSQVTTVTCGYDPLGRLILACQNGGPWLGYDGENVIRTDPHVTNTFWTFVHAPGTDDPVIGRYTQDATYGRTHFFVTDGQGRQYAVGRVEGWDASDDQQYLNNGGKYSGAGEVATGFGTQRMPSTSQPGLAFFRNRFYDQQTGRWTQEDPIGIAGGLNLYAYAGNNPVAYGDPFGLCPEPEKKDNTVCVAFFIQKGEVMGLKGDGRKFSSRSDPSQSRIYLHIDVASQSYQVVQNRTCNTQGECRDPLASNTVGVTFGADGGFTVSVHAKNSIKTGAPAIDATINFTPNAQGSFTARPNRDRFPSVEAYHWRAGTATPLLQRGERTPFHLFPWMPNDRF